jgi:hypothetical protein
VYTSCVLGGALRFFNEILLLIKKKKSDFDSENSKIPQGYIYTLTHVRGMLTSHIPFPLFNVINLT